MTTEEMTKFENSITASLNELTRLMDGERDNGYLVDMTLQVEKLLHYPITTSLFNWFLDKSNMDQFIKSHEDRNIAVGVMICSKSDPLKLIINLLTLLHNHDIVKFKLNDFNEFFQEMKKIEIQKDTILDINRVKKIVEIFRECKIMVECPEFDESYVYPTHKHVKVVVINEDYIADAPIDNVKNLYVVIDWFKDELKRHYPSTQLIHMKSCVNNRVCVQRNVFCQYIRHTYGNTVDFINIVDDDDIQTSMDYDVNRLEITYEGLQANRATYTDSITDLLKYVNEPKAKDRNNYLFSFVEKYYGMKRQADEIDEKYFQRIKERLEKTGAGIDIDELDDTELNFAYMDNMAAVNAIMRSNILYKNYGFAFVHRDYDGNCIYARYYSTLCPHYINTFLNTLQIQGEDAASNYIFETIFNLTADGYYIHQTLNYESSNRYIKGNKDVYSRMIINNYTRMLIEIIGDVNKDFVGILTKAIEDKFSINMKDYIEFSKFDDNGVIKTAKGETKHSDEITLMCVSRDLTNIDNKRRQQAQSWRTINNKDVSEIIKNQANDNERCLLYIDYLLNSLEIANKPINSHDDILWAYLYRLNEQYDFFNELNGKYDKLKKEWLFAPAIDFIHQFILARIGDGCDLSDEELINNIKIISKKPTAKDEEEQPPPGDIKFYTFGEIFTDDFYNVLIPRFYNIKQKLKQRLHINEYFYLMKGVKYTLMAFFALSSDFRNTTAEKNILGEINNEDDIINMFQEYPFIEYNNNEFLLYNWNKMLSSDEYNLSKYHGGNNKQQTKNNILIMMIIILAVIVLVVVAIIIFIRFKNNAHRKPIFESSYMPTIC